MDFCDDLPQSRLTFVIPCLIIKSGGDFMYRQAFQKLTQWKESIDRKPLIIRGARQVGKTWLMKEFGRNYFNKVAYINFDSNPLMEELFKGDLNIPRLLANLQLATGVSISPNDTLLIFDEIQEVPRALTSLKYFNENAPEFAIVAAGSLLGIALHPGTSFPVGKVSFLDLYPLSFPEFLKASGQERYQSWIEDPEALAHGAFHNQMTELLAQYLVVGGMPRAVAAFIEEPDMNKVRLIQSEILSAYEQDFSKHAPVAAVPRLRLLWQSVPSQLAQLNRKFIYKNIQPGARAREYELAMQWLIDCGLIHRVHRVSKPGLPLAAYSDLSAFKLYFNDVGLLGACSQLDPRVILAKNAIFEEFKGALTEQYVLQQLLAADLGPAYYWSPESGNAEVDFLLQLQGQVYPLEVKAAENLQSKSLRSYYEKYQPSVSLRTSLSGYRQNDWLVNIPLYSISSLPTLLH
jgi:uncharacterized protein